ncbi:uncharacterized protein [Muntiacus reevesi]|uniref:uncharacterized protein n=1 Tax=Muntiacus reevesi TaxID=9886 RepID=UPI0033077BEE
MYMDADTDGLLKRKFWTRRNDIPPDKRTQNTGELKVVLGSEDIAVGVTQPHGCSPTLIRAHQEETRSVLSTVYNNSSGILLWQLPPLKEPNVIYSIPASCPSTPNLKLEVREWDALSAAGLTPGDWVRPPAPRAGLGWASPSTETEQRGRPASGSARGACALGAGQAVGLAAGSSASPGLEPAAVGAGSPSRSPLSGVQRGPPPRGPLSAALPVGLPVGLGQGLSPGLTATGSPSPTWRLRTEKQPDFLSTLLRVDSGISRKLLEHPARAFAVSPRSGEETQLPPKSCLPLPPKAPRRFGKRGARSAKDLSSGGKMSVTAPNERWVLLS